VKIDLGAFSAQYGDKVLTGRLTPEGTVVPFYERREIEESGALNGRAPVLTWMESEVDLFFLQIQGSGRVILEDGRILHVHYDSSNGQPYRSIGKLLIDENKIPLEEMSMQKIRAYLEAHPEDLRRVLNYNPSYVFFKLEEDGPLGCLNVKLTPGRSIALDRRIFPLPVLAYVETEKPLIDGSGNIVGWQRFGRFAVSQDTGGAIKGPARADLYWGSGTYAEIAAGHMRHRGPLYMLVLKPGREQTAEVAANAASSAAHPAVR
jgi:membrane-bound lytic murein transglycosylase A